MSEALNPLSRSPRIWQRAAEVMGWCWCWE